MASAQNPAYVDLLDVLVVVLNREGIVTFVNKKACRVLDGSSDEIVGKNWFEHFLPASMKDQMLVLLRQIS